MMTGEEIKDRIDIVLEDSKILDSHHGYEFEKICQSVAVDNLCQLFLDLLSEARKEIEEFKKGK